MKETSANVNQENLSRKYYLSEFSYDDGEYEITFNIIDISFVYETITVAITRAGKDKITVLEKVGDNDYIVDYKGVHCHALFNPFVCAFFADDIYRIVE